MLLTLTGSPRAVAGLRAPYVPAGADTVLQQVPASTDPRVRRFDTLREQLRSHPHDMKRALTLSRAYIDYGRATGDARFLGRGLAVIKPWLAQNPAPIPVAVIHATILQSRHHFAASRRELEAILKRQPTNIQARLTLATVATVQGDIDTARHACAHLIGMQNELVTAACIGEVNAVSGKAQQAIDIMQLMLKQTPNASPGLRSYIQGLLADCNKYLGRPAQADRHFRKALQLEPGDNFLLADYGDFLLDQNRPADALALVKNYPQSDTSFMRLVFAKAALNKPTTQSDIRQMSERFKAMAQRGSHVYRREQARFVLYLEHDPQRALALAQKNWTVQRAPKDIRIYLEAALAAHQAAAAQPVLKLLAQTRLQDPVVRSLVRKVRAALPPHTVAEAGRP